MTNQSYTSRHFRVLSLAVSFIVSAPSAPHTCQSGLQLLSFNHLMNCLCWLKMTFSTTMLTLWLYKRYLVAVCVMEMAKHGIIGMFRLFQDPRMQVLLVKGDCLFSTAACRHEFMVMVLSKWTQRGLILPCLSPI